MKQMFSHDGGKTWPSHHVISDKVGFNYTSIRPSHRVQFKAAVAQAKDSKIAVMTFHCVHAVSQRRSLHGDRDAGSGEVCGYEKVIPAQHVLLQP
jgi:hypothetical protein